MKKSLAVAALCGVMLCSGAEAREYFPYVGFDYVNMTPNVSDRMPDNYNIGNLTAGFKLVDFGALEFFAGRSLKEKNTVDGNVSRGRMYGYGADMLFNAYTAPEAALLLSVGYGRMSTKLKYNGSTDKDTANTLRLGFGGEINPSPVWGFRAMFRYSLSDGDAYNNAKEFTLGARYYFPYF